MSEELNEPDTVPAGAGNDDSIPSAGDFTTDVDPTFIPDENEETPEERLSRVHPEATGS